VATSRRRPGPGLIHHSDQGSQYVSLAFTRRLAEAEICGSMGGVGTAYDNTARRGPVRHHQKGAGAPAPVPHAGGSSLRGVEFIEVFYNRRRLHSSLAYLSPNEFERRFQQEREDATAA
jgi:transposase InsO family protein